MKDYKDRCCNGIGDKNQPKYMIVGMCGGRLGCIRTGIPFTKDGSGKLFIRAMKELGFTKSNEWDLDPVYENVYVTNLVKGTILADDGFNRNPTDSEIAYWWSEFIDEVVTIKPEHIVAVGNLVYGYLKDSHKFSDIHDIWHIKHPSYYLRHGALGKARPAWNEMLEEYTLVIGVNDRNGERVQGNLHKNKV